jgi:hypothetical protein
VYEADKASDAAGHAVQMVLASLMADQRSRLLIQCHLISCMPCTAGRTADVEDSQAAAG